VLANEALALAAGSLGVLLCEGRDRRHLDVVALAAQPAEKGALSCSVSSRSVLARRRSRDTATLAA
jgi:hypothetical protein